MPIGNIRPSCPLSYNTAVHIFVFEPVSQQHSFNHCVHAWFCVGSFDEERERERGRRMSKSLINLNQKLYLDAFKFTCALGVIPYCTRATLILFSSGSVMSVFFHPSTSKKITG